MTTIVKDTEGRVDDLDFKTAGGSEGGKEDDGALERRRGAGASWQSGSKGAGRGLQHLVRSLAKQDRRRKSRKSKAKDIGALTDDGVRVPAATGLLSGLLWLWEDEASASAA